MGEGSRISRYPGRTQGPGGRVMQCDNHVAGDVSELAVAMFAIDEPTVAASRCLHTNTSEEQISTVTPGQRVIRRGRDNDVCGRGLVADHSDRLRVGSRKSY